MTKALQRMEGDGLVERHSDPGDGRRVRIHLSPRARELEPVLKSTIARLNEQALRGLSTDERVCVMGALGGIIENSETMLDR